jgi:hypothetical protein
VALRSIKAAKEDGVMFAREWCVRNDRLFTKSELRAHFDRTIAIDIGEGFGTPTSDARGRTGTVYHGYGEGSPSNVERLWVHYETAARNAATRCLKAKLPARPQLSAPVPLRDVIGVSPRQVAKAKPTALQVRQVKAAFVERGYKTPCLAGGRVAVFSESERRTKKFKCPSCGRQLATPGTIMGRGYIPIHAKEG